MNNFLLPCGFVVFPRGPLGILCTCLWDWLMFFVSIVFYWLGSVAQITLSKIVLCLTGTFSLFQDRNVLLVTHILLLTQIVFL